MQLYFCQAESISSELPSHPQGTCCLPTCDFKHRVCQGPGKEVVNGNIPARNTLFILALTFREEWSSVELRVTHNCIVNVLKVCLFYYLEQQVRGHPLELLYK